LSLNYGPDHAHSSLAIDPILGKIVAGGRKWFAISQLARRNGFAAQIMDIFMRPFEILGQRRRQAERVGILCLVMMSLAQAAPAVAAVANVSVNDDYFSPSTTSINAGDTVIWTWGNDFDSHNIVSTSTPFAWLFPSPGGGPGTTSDQNSANTRNSPFSFTNTFTSTGSFPYECTPHADEGMVGTVIVAAPPPPPIVDITNPVAGQVFSAPADLTIEASAFDSSGSVTNVQFLIGSTVLTNCVTAPFFAVTNNLQAGTYTLSAIATDNNGLTASKSITVSVVTPNPVVTGTPAFVSTGTFQFSYSTTIGLSYLVQVSTNLLNWTSLATNTATANPETFTDKNAGSKAAFYRVELKPNP
jgi:plastocyanin